MKTSELLKAEYRRRVGHDCQYNSKQFALDLGVSPAFLSLIFSGKRQMSESSALKVCERLKLKSQDKDNFMVAYRFESSRDSAYRKVLKKANFTNERYKTIGFNEFAPIAKWYNAAIIELTYLSDFSPDPTWISRKLRIPQLEAELALRRLVRLGLLNKDKDGRVKVSQQVAVKEMPSRSIRQFHGQMIGKAIDALEGQAFDERDISGITMAIKKERLPQAYEAIKTFRRQLADMMQSDESDSVYQLNVQFFKLDHGE